MSKKKIDSQKGMRELSAKDRKFVDKHMMLIMEALHLPKENEKCDYIKTVMGYTQGMYSDVVTSFQQGFLYSAKNKFHSDRFVGNAFGYIRDKEQYNAELYCNLTDITDPLEFWTVQGYFSGLAYKGVRDE